MRVLRSAARSIQGRRREQNQDRFLLAEQRGFVLLADGAAERALGARAAEMAVATVETHLGAVLDTGDVAPPRGTDALREAFRLADWKVLQEAHCAEMLPRMATTLVAALFTHEQVVVASVGDSRAYRLRHAFLKQISTDDVVQPAELARLPAQDRAVVEPLAQLLTPVVGGDVPAEPHVYVEALQAEDLYLLCSNGLSDVLPDHLIAEIVVHAGSLDAACEALVGAAVEHGAEDDVTVVLVQPDASSARQEAAWA